MLRQSKKLTIKDLVTTGIFTALYLVFTMVGGAFFAVNPVLVFLMPLGVTLLTGPIFHLLIAKVPKHGPILIMGILMAVIWFMTGMYWMISVGFVVSGILGEIISGAGEFKNKALNIVSFLLMSLFSQMQPFITLLIKPSVYTNYMLKQGSTQEYLDTMMTTLAGWMVPAILAAGIVCGLISSFVGFQLLKKQFVKAGIVK